MEGLSTRPELQEADAEATLAAHPCNVYFCAATDELYSLASRIHIQSIVPFFLPVAASTAHISVHLKAHTQAQHYFIDRLLTWHLSLRIESQDRRH